MHLVRREADADAGAAGQHAAVHLAGGDQLRDLVAADGIVEPLRAVGADVDDLDALAFEIRLDIVLHVDGDMIVSNR